MKKARIAILASGEGTTAEAFIRSCAAGDVKADVVLVICNIQHAGVFNRIAKINHECGLNIQSLWINGKTHPARPNETVHPGDQTTAEQAAIMDALAANNIDLVALLGFMKRVGPQIVNAYGWQPSYTSIYQARMINTHPGPLPETKGMHGIHVQEHILREQLPFGAQTLHVVAENYDDGPIIAVNKVAILDGDTPASLFDRVRTTEKAHIGSDINKFIIERETFIHT